MFAIFSIRGDGYRQFIDEFYRCALVLHVMEHDKNRVSGTNPFPSEITQHGCNKRH